ncbi:hypothetical protein CEP54_004795 [Fusarium duplospermum]|uniref:Cell wall galactomannoprotein n=1 Tax=Fusarium duplospermum TaxID=1325734 RepID=A0A428QG80_9HYPO|nr:hypothetical protein CEP54_004795 [Fusarium duplospermum]
MRFSLNFVLLGAASVANAFISPSQLIRGIDDLIHKTEDLIKPAGQLSISNAPSLILGSGPFFEVITGLRDVTRLTTDIGGSLSGATKGTFEGKDGDQIVASVKKLSDTFGNLLDAFLEKADIFGEIPFVGAPFRIAIALTKHAFQEFTGTIIDTLSGQQANDARSSVQSVDGKFSRTITITEN